jgi:hypothetical protein
MLGLLFRLLPFPGSLFGYCAEKHIFSRAQDFMNCLEITVCLIEEQFLGEKPTLVTLHLRRCMTVLLVQCCFWQPLPFIGGILMYIVESTSYACYIQ